MARYTVQCDICSQDMDFHTFGGNSRDRQWRADHWSHECDECKRKRIALENEKNAEKNREEGLPALVGSEKQIAWAETIRAGFIADANIFIQKSEKVYKALSDKNEKITKREVMKVMMSEDFNLHNRTFIFENNIETINM